jgi:hypothetical protein
MPTLLKRIRLFLGTTDAYIPILKAGYVLVAAALIALSQLGPEMIKMDHEAYKLKFEVELASKKPIEATDCTALGPQAPACFQAQHQLKTLEVSLRLWGNFVQNTAAVGTILVMVGLIGWLMPLFGKSEP